MTAITWLLTFGIAYGVFSVLSQAILAFTSIVIEFVIPPVITDIIGVISVYLPFNPAGFFATFAYFASGVLTFLIALKVFEILTSVLKSAKA